MSVGRRVCGVCLILAFACGEDSAGQAGQAQSGTADAGGGPTGPGDAGGPGLPAGSGTADGGATSNGGDEETAGAAGNSGDTPPDMPSDPCPVCSADLRSVIDCEGNVVMACQGTDGCDQNTGTCINACDAAASARQTVGCEYYSTSLEHWQDIPQRCFAAFIANTWNSSANLDVELGGVELDVETFAYIPTGSGPSLTYTPYDSASGLAPGEVAILFLAGETAGGDAPCPQDAAIPEGTMVVGTGIGSSFRITSDVPVVAYQINPFGGGGAAITGASLLLPTAAWDTQYVVVNPLPESNGVPTTNIIAASDDTTITIDPVVDLEGGPGVPGTLAGVAVNLELDSGEHAQLSQSAELSGSRITASAPVGLMGGHSGMFAPVDTQYSDHAEQMIPPLRSLGTQYVGVMHRPRVNEPGIWRVIGVEDNTTLTWSSDVGGPDTLDRGEAIEFITDVPFVVRSQGNDNPFVLLNIMSGSQWQLNLDGYGDSDFVISVPPAQYMRRYVFFADPSYPETNLVLVRRRVNGEFRDVELDCLGTVTGWSDIGDFQWSRVDLISGDFEPVGGCSTGRHELTTNGAVGLWIWGWGTPETVAFTENVSYGYPGGMGLAEINEAASKPKG